MRNLLFYLLALCMAVSCNSDDDICMSGEATPRLKIKFKDANNKLLNLRRIYVDVDYGGGAKNIIQQQLADSVMVPLRVDNNTFTDIYIRTSEAGKKAKIRVSYTTESQYVSPACGYKKLYKDMSTALESPNPVTGVEQIQTDIINEKGQHIYLIF